MSFFAFGINHLLMIFVDSFYFYHICGLIALVKLTETINMILKPVAITKQIRGDV